MAFQIIWQPPAQKRFHKIVEYLQHKWGDVAVRNFVARVDEVTELLKDNPLMYRASGKAYIRELVLTKHNVLLYRIKANQVEILTIFDTRQHPKKKYDK